MGLVFFKKWNDFFNACLIVIRPDLIDVLYLGSFPDPFQSAERNKIKRKNRQKIAWKFFGKIIYLKKIYFLFPGFFPTFFNVQCTGG